MMQRMLLLACLMLFSGSALAQMAYFRGQAKDREGKPIVGAAVLFRDQNTGRKYETKTDSRGEYTQNGVLPGVYNVDLIVDGQTVQNFTGIQPSLGIENRLDFDLAKPPAGGLAAGAPSPGTLTPEQKKQADELAKKNADIMKENEKRKQANALLQKLDEALGATPPDHELATQYAQQITELVPDVYIGWARLGEVAALARKHDLALQANQKAIELVLAQPDPTGKNKPLLANLYNNLGSAYARSGKAQEALAQYTAAAQTDPAKAAQYYYNAGAVLTNTYHPDEANTAFDKAIAADPNYADAWYQKGINLLGKGTLDPKTGKTNYPPEASQALQKYLELQPNGKNAQTAKELLARMGEEVQTTFRKKK